MSTEGMEQHDQSDDVNCMCICCSKSFSVYPHHHHLGDYPTQRILCSECLQALQSAIIREKEFKKL